MRLNFTFRNAPGTPAPMPALAPGVPAPMLALAPDAPAPAPGVSRRIARRMFAAPLLAFALLALALAALLSLTACAGSGAGVAVRNSVNDYSWGELAAIANEIAAASDEPAALAIAQRYHLTADDGTLDGNQAKDVELAGGMRTRAIVADFNHEQRADGKKAGITFVFADAVALHEMNNDAGHTSTAEADDFDALGGWNASEMRRWLNDEFARQLPDDLRASLADVVKAGIVVPQRETTVDDAGALLTPADSLVGQGVDRLWIPALVELSGVSDESEAARDFPEWSAPLKAEGSQYRLFAQTGVAEGKANAILVRTLALPGGTAGQVGGDGGSGEGGGSGDGDREGRRWWLRSVEDWSFAHVLEDGSIDRRDHVPAGGTAQAVVPCFALGT